ncbi:MAG: calcium/sodium antiporter [Acidiferrobacterales bacterium]|nr:calcium/sodium antiporter [Acidiferrobacterales bacterium]
MDLMVYLLLIVGIVLLMIGAEVMVRGAEQIALGFGISPLVVGLTVVAFGTSAPELAVGIRSALLDQADIALGNVVGSNILNILLILGLSAMITPMVVESRIIRREIPILLFVSFLLFALALDGTIASIEGVILFAGSVVYTVYAIRKSRKEASESTTVEERESPLKAMAFVLVGLGMLVFGAELLVDNAVILARWFGVSELLIGLTIVSIGTSLPEIATSVVAAMRGMRDMAVGNVIGSCLFNVLAVSGATAIFASGGLSVDPGLLQFDLPVMLAATVACLPIFATGHVISRWEGCVFFVYYLAYTTYLLLFSHGSESVEVMNWAMLSFVLPLTFVTLAILWYRDLKA